MRTVIALNCQTLAEAFHITVDGGQVRACLADLQARPSRPRRLTVTAQSDECFLCLVLMGRPRDKVIAGRDYRITDGLVREIGSLATEVSWGLRISGQCTLLIPSLVMELPVVGGAVIVQ